MKSFKALIDYGNDPDHTSCAVIHFNDALMML